MAPQKRICFTGRTCSLARCANTNCEWTECNATSLEMNSSKKGEKAKHKPQAIAVLNSRIIHRTDRTQRSQGARKPGGTRRPGEGHQERGWQDTTVQQSHLLLVPNFSSAPEVLISGYFLLLRTRHLLLDRFLSTFTLLLTAALLLLSSSHCS